VSRQEILAGSIDGRPNKAGRFEHLDRLRRHFVVVPIVRKLVSRELLLEETVEGLVTIKCPYDVIPIAPRIRPKRVCSENAFGVGVACKVKPVASPTLPVARAVEEPINYLF